VLAKLADTLGVKKNRDVALTGLGMGALLAGQRALGLSLFAKGMVGLEEHWREVNAFTGTGRERWDQAIAFYEATHQHPVNRALHVVGIPLVLGGAVGLLASRPLRPVWLAGAASFTLGWGLNFIGHGVFEKKAPAFADDPLSFIAGPVWDAQHLGRLLGLGSPAPGRTGPTIDAAPSSPAPAAATNGHHAVASA
jgi:hypothetical protein